MFLGNDIVDLSFALTNFKKKKERLFNYTLSKSEKEKFHTELKSPDFFWLVWSIKESLYKSYVKAGYHKRYDPNKIEVLQIIKNSENNWTAKSIDFSGNSFQVSSFTNNDIIHSVSFLEKKKEDYTSKYMHVDSCEYTVHHQKVRELLYDMLPPDKKEYEIVKNEFHIPVLTKNGVISELDISLSHHGNYIATVYDPV